MKEIRAAAVSTKNRIGDTDYFAFFTYAMFFPES